MPLRDPDALAERYVTMWSEPDPARRRDIIEELWAPGGAHLLQPPEEVRAEADRLGIVGAGFEAVGHDAIEHRVTTAYEDFVVRQKYTFRFPGNAQRLKNTVMFRWESLPTASRSAPARNSSCSTPTTASSPITCSRADQPAAVSATTGISRPAAFVSWSAKNGYAALISAHARARSSPVNGVAVAA